ncbi:MAG: cytochrome c [Nitrospirae bacterium]|nr:cytochrome c [Nitrospirota bacterium]
MKSIFALVVIILAISFESVGAGDNLKTISLPQVNVELREGDGKAKTVTLCAVCHSLDYITTQPALTRAQWTGTMNKMIKVMGAPISEEDAGIITGYLTKQYGSGN